MLLNYIKQILLSPAGSFASVFLLMFLVGWSIHIITKRAVLRSERKKAEKLENSLETIKSGIQEIKEMVLNQHK